MRRLLQACFAAVALLWVTHAESVGVAPVSGKPAAGAHKPEMTVTEADRSRWAFRPLAEVSVPDSGNPIDALLLEKGTPAPREASRRTQIRRLHLDLLGLPPTPEEVEAFERDTAPDAYERLVDRLLASRHYGERWARHWLDVARYADSDGYEGDRDRNEAWPYRDWVIRALNDDLPFNIFVQWQIAGDEIVPGNPDAVMATGFLAAGPSQETTPADTEENKLKIRYDELDDMVSTTASAFLGLTLGCARCHDHKFDPLPTRDYYRMAAVFSTSERRVASLSKPRRELDLWKEQQRAAHRESRMTELNLTEDQKFWLRQPEHFFVPIQLKLYKEFGERLKVDDAGLRAWLPESQLQVWDSLERAASKPAMASGLTGKSLIVMDHQAAPEPQYLLARGGVLNRKEPVSAGFIQVASRGKAPEAYRDEVALHDPLTSPQLAAVDDGGFTRPPTTYQRKALAAWLTDVDHGAGPLVARVIVNRVWQHHFGEGLVRTSNDFGSQGEAPTQPRLLEWLAGELVRGGWKLKPLHRQIVLSASYRAAATPSANSVRHPFRLESDALRDSMLAVSGQLNRKMFGPPFRPIIPKEAMATRSKDEYPANLQDGPELWRRSVYAFSKRSVPNPLLEVFDSPDSSSSCGRRNVTTVPTQALTLLNNEQVRKSAVQFAQRVITDAGLNPEAQIERAYRLALARTPTADERVRALQFLAAASDSRGDALPVEGLTDLCHVLFTLNEFIYVD